MPLGDADLSALARTIDPILDQLIDGAMKGELHGDDLVDIATRIRAILHEAVARRASSGASSARPVAAATPGGDPSLAAGAGG
jgi:hypothetical protein